MGMQSPLCRHVSQVPPILSKSAPHSRTHAWCSHMHLLVGSAQAEERKSSPQQGCSPTKGRMCKHYIGIPQQEKGPVEKRMSLLSESIPPVKDTCTMFAYASFSRRIVLLLKAVLSSAGAFSYWRTHVHTSCMHTSAPKPLVLPHKGQVASGKKFACVEASWTGPLEGGGTRSLKGSPSLV